jgi:hypothetical protein
MPPERITLHGKVREYFAEIGKRGERAGRRKLTRQQAKLMVDIREAKRAAKKKANLLQRSIARRWPCSGNPMPNGLNATSPSIRFHPRQTINVHRKPVTIDRIETESFLNSQIAAVARGR